MGKISVSSAQNIINLEASKRFFWSFCLYYDYPFFSQRTFLKEIADAFQQVEKSEIKSLSVSMPPRAGKSYITSLFCAWTLGRNPSESVMRNTCTATLYLKFSYDVRAIIKNERYTDVFGVRLSEDKKNLQGWNLNQSKMVSYFGAGVGGTIIGFGATKIAITDDLYRGLEDALSEGKNERILQWKEATHDSRMESGCARIDIGTRWSLSDVIGRSMERGDYEKSIIVPALDEHDRSFCESVMTTDEYLDKRKKTAKEIWLAEYQQQPIDVMGRLFGDLDVISENEYITLTKSENHVEEGSLAYVDVADQGTDYLACIVAKIVKDKLYIVDYVYSRDNTDVTLPLVASILNKHNVSYCRVESNSMGAMYSRTLQKLTNTRILQITNSTNKITRIVMHSAYIINNFVWVKYDTPFCIQFLDNMFSFSKEGKNKNDDAPDCASGLSMFVQSMLTRMR